jgi:hypothetical protein
LCHLGPKEIAVDLHDVFAGLMRARGPMGERAA